MYLSLDVGTQSVRALLFNREGQLIGIGRRRLPAPERPHPGWAEFDPVVFWGALVAAVTNLRDQVGDLSKVASVCLTCQRGTIVAVDRHGAPVYPAISWMDQRITQNPPEIPWWLALVFKVAGHAKTLNYFRQQAEANWLFVHRHAQWQKIDKFLLLSAYLNHRLIGSYKDSYANTVGYVPFDYKNLCWTPKRDWRWKVLALRPEMMPSLCAPGDIMGQLTDEAAEQLGLPYKLPVIAGASDKACESLGCGVINAQQTAISLGTTLTISVTRPDYKEIFPLLPPYPAAIPGYYSNEYMISRGFWMVTWFLENFGHPEKASSATSGRTVENELNHLLDKTPVGNDGLIALPYWNPGIIHPGVEARGAFSGITADHSRANIYRALIEGLAYETRYGLERMKKRLKLRELDIVVAGGGSRNSSILQIFADMLNQPLYRPQTSEASGLGAAIIQAVTLGDYSNWMEACRHMCQIQPVASPNPRSNKIYQKLYNEIYRSLQRQLSPIHKRLFRHYWF